MKKYIDTETGKIITENELFSEFELLKAEDPETYDYTAADYIRNCTAKNGTLKAL